MKRREFLKRAALSTGALSTVALATSPLSIPLPNLLASTQQKLQRKGRAKRVLIIGAGLAGLSAAYELTNAGHDVTIFEAQTRPGGRVFTLREPFSDGMYAEAGASSSWYKPGQMGELWPHIARSEGRVHFAGDHTSPWIRWMQGALHSGNRVAREVNDS